MTKKEWIILQTAKGLRAEGFSHNLVEKWVNCAYATSVKRANRIVRRFCRKAERENQIKQLTKIK